MKTVAALFLNAVALSLPSVAYTLPYAPDVLDVYTLSARFIETGTNTACVNCEDADSTNDLIATLYLVDGGGWGGYGWYGGYVTFSGDMLSVRDMYLGIEADVKVVTQLTNAPPWEIAVYPLPSVIYGTLEGHLIGANRLGELIWPDFIEDCCWGDVGGANFKSPKGDSFWNATDVTIPLNTEIHWQGMPYSPEVTAAPEPTTLLLLGSGLIGAAWKRRRGHGHQLKVWLTAVPELSQFLKGGQL